MWKLFLVPPAQRIAVAETDQTGWHADQLAPLVTDVKAVLRKACWVWCFSTPPANLAKVNKIAARVLAVVINWSEHVDRGSFSGRQRGRRSTYA